ncbi:MAG: NAD-dependent epimerase/dehydratase family protein [Candidatus Omnitrophota bacterium]
MPQKQTSLKNKKVLITGGLGFIGSNLAHKCLQLGASVTIYDCLDQKSGGNIYNIEDIKKDVALINDDIRNFQALSLSLAKKEIVFNCAAYTSHPNSMKEPLIDIDINCKGTLNLLEAVRKFEPEAKIVHIGTSTQIGKMEFKVIDEMHPEFPLDIYSANKSVSEKYVLLYGNAYALDTTVLRLANNFGPRSNIKSPDFGFMNYFIGLGLQGKEINVFGSGSQLRNVNFVDDSVAALILAALNPESKGQVFFVVGDRQYTVLQIAEAIARNIGGKIKFVGWPEEREAIEIGDAVISNKKVKKMLSWEAKYGIDEGLKKTKDYFDSCLNRYL